MRVEGEEPDAWSEGSGRCLSWVRRCPPSGTGSSGRSAWTSPRRCSRSQSSPSCSRSPQRQALHHTFFIINNRQLFVNGDVLLRELKAKANTRTQLLNLALFLCQLMEGIMSRKRCTTVYVRQWVDSIYVYYELMNYLDTKAKCSHLKIFWVNCCLSSLFYGSTLPSSPFPVWIKHLPRSPFTGQFL